MAITQDDIFAAADALDKEGIKPTLSAIRKHLGSGSFTTISDAMNVWKQRREAKEEQSKDPLPPALADAINECMGSLWSLASSVAEKRLDADRAKHAQEMASMNEALSEAIELADSCSKENEALLKDKEALQVTLANEQKISATFSVQLEAEKKRVTQLEQDLDKSRMEAREAIEAAASVRGQLDAYKEQLAALTKVTAATKKTKGSDQ